MCHVTDYYIKPCLLPWGGTTHSLTTTVLVIISVGHQLHTNLHYNLLLRGQIHICCMQCCWNMLSQNRIRWPITWRTKRLCVQKPCTAPDYAEIQPNVKKMPHLTLQEKHTQADIYSISNHNRAPQQPKHTEAKYPGCYSPFTGIMTACVSQRCWSAVVCRCCSPAARLHDTESLQQLPVCEGREETGLQHKPPTSATDEGLWQKNL